MSQVMVTIVAPLDPARLPAADALIDRLGNPATPAVREKLDRLDGDLGVHFISAHALPSFTSGRAHLVLEFSADGDAARALRQIIGAIGPELADLFALARDWRGGDLGAYLTGRIITTGFGLGQSPGLAHSGNPGMTVGRIRAEAALAAQVETILAAQGSGMSALERLQDVRRQLGPGDPALTPAEGRPPFVAKSIPAIILPTLTAFAATYLWPFLAALGAWIVWSGWRAAVGPAGGMGEALTVLAAVWRSAWTGAALLVVGLLAALGGLYLRLLQLEASDWISSRAPDRATLHEIIARENLAAQNHMMSLTEIKAGWLRTFTLRLVFFAVGTVGPMLYKPGYLGPIGTIHFARWVTPPGTRDLIFLSNYGGSWEAYLEDFITLAHNGLTGVWSNTVGFPKTSNLIAQGATDGERFKRYARQSMRPTRFWYSAYPELVTDMIRANSQIRRGLSGAMTEDDAQTWLLSFGSTLRPDDRLETSEIQSLVFGGLGFLPYGALSLWRLPGELRRARAWLADIAPLLAYGDGRRVREDCAIEAIAQLAVSSAGLEALGLPPEGLATFPPAFLDDMTHPHRARILGDSGPDAPEYWWWGRRPGHVALLTYGKSEAALADLDARLTAIAATHGADLEHVVPMAAYDPARNAEPFGFADGISQPVIRGAYKGLKSGDPLHLVEPGEFVLGYPDNRGNLPPGPTLSALDDPENELPVLDGGTDFSRSDVNNPRDLGFNGSYLVIRQLEQDPEAFDAYCAEEARRLATRLGPPYRITPDFIAAKLVGRWRNGAPIVRSPYSASEAPEIIAENGFELGSEDPEGLRCPFGAHIRRANPRDSLNPGSTDQISISNRHRIMRIGRKYAHGPGQKPGLLFMCLNGDLERQFEFVQQTWLHGPVISLSCPITLSGEKDPLLSPGDSPENRFTVPSTDGPVKLSPMKRFVTLRGGGYFFLPGKRLIRYLSR